MKMIKNKIDKYPVVQLWRRTSSTAREYTKMNSEEIRLDAGNFTVNGVIQYQLSVILLGSIRIETYWEFTCITQHMPTVSFKSSIKIAKPLHLTLEG